jgi:chromosome segregation ATPase
MEKEISNLEQLLDEKHDELDKQKRDHEYLKRQMTAVNQENQQVLADLEEARDYLEHRDREV